MDDDDHYADLLTRIRALGGIVYRTHSLEYVYVRRTTGHTFITEIDTLVQQGERLYPGLPQQLLSPAYGPAGQSRPARSENQGR